MNFVSDATAKSILRGTIRTGMDAVPSMADIEARLVKVQTLWPNLPKMQKVLHEYAKPWAYYIRFTSNKKDETFSCEFIVPEFVMEHNTWNIKIRSILLSRIKDQKLIIKALRPSITIYGHALERVFQRAKVLGWHEINRVLKETALSTYMMWHNCDNDIHKIVTASTDGAFVGYLEEQDGTVFGDGTAVHKRNIVLKTFYSNEVMATKVKPVHQCVSTALVQTWEAILEDGTSNVRGLTPFDINGTKLWDWLKEHHPWLTEPEIIDMPE